MDPEIRERMERELLLAQEPARRRRGPWIAGCVLLGSAALAVTGTGLYRRTPLAPEPNPLAPPSGSVIPPSPEPQAKANREEPEQASACTLALVLADAAQGERIVRSLIHGIRPDPQDGTSSLLILSWEEIEILTDQLRELPSVRSVKLEAPPPHLLTGRDLQSRLPLHIRIRSPQEDGPEDGESLLN
jgi:hypothetical protein